MSERDVELLRKWIKIAVRAGSIEEFALALTE